MSKARVDEIRQVSTHESYHGWPTIIRRDNGELLVVVSAGRISHICPFGQIHLLRSSDEGRTWTRQTTINTQLDDRDCGVLETRDGTLLLNWFTSVAWLRNSRRAGSRVSEDLMTALCQKVALGMSDELLARELGPWVIRSEDGGRTWSEKINPAVGSPHGPTELDDGRLLYVGNPKIENPEQSANGSPYAPGLAASESGDDGRSWTRVSDIPVREGDTPDNYHEPHAVQAADGRIIVHIRNHNEQDKHMLLQCESEDGGRTWTTPRSIGVFGFPAHLLRLRDGRLLSTYGYRRDPYGNRAIVSSDSGRSWSEPMTLTAEEPRRDIGYPSTAEMPDGSLITVWYEFLHHLDRAVVRMAHWSIT